jgi:hypothetical protein
MTAADRLTDLMTATPTDLEPLVRKAGLVIPILLMVGFLAAVAIGIGIGVWIAG